MYLKTDCQMISSKPTFVLDIAGLSSLIDELVGRGYKVIGPTVRDGAIVYDRIGRVEDLPVGWTEEQDAATYRLKRRSDEAFFGFNNGPHSWKRFLFPPREKLWEATQSSGGLRIIENDDQDASYAFLGVRACDLHAIQVQDLVFINHRNRDSKYESRRNKSFIVAVNCGQAAKTCFCTSMNTGPRVGTGYDIALTEVMEDGSHYFYVETGSEAGDLLVAGLPVRTAELKHEAASQACTARAVSQMGRTLPAEGVKELLYRNYENSHWEDIAQRCLSCANCTMVCPTCFCSRVEEVTDLTGDHAERWREWDSCFTMDFSYIHGGTIRQSTRSRYRQWLTHKLATWFDQFGSSGCVGCGRCITWCPVGIDLTAEVKAIMHSELEKDHSGNKDN